MLDLKNIPDKTIWSTEPKKRSLLFQERPLIFYGAGNEIRTRDVNLGKVALYH